MSERRGGVIRRLYSRFALFWWERLDRNQRFGVIIAINIALFLLAPWVKAIELAVANFVVTAVGGLTEFSFQTQVLLFLMILLFAQITLLSRQLNGIENVLIDMREEMSRTATDGGEEDVHQWGNASSVMGGAAIGAALGSILGPAGALGGAIFGGALGAEFTHSEQERRRLAREPGEKLTDYKDQ